MLINTVFIFLQNILPIFVVISLLFAQQEVSKQSSKGVYNLPVVSLLQTATIGLIIVSLLSYNMATISQLFSGSGLEIIFSISFCLIYCFIVLSFLMRSGIDEKTLEQKNNIRQQTLLSLAILLLVFCVHGSYFSLYVMSLTMQGSSFESLSFGNFIGVIIGTGISLSIAILLYFILVALDKKTSIKVTSYFLLFFAVGQLMQALQLLEQVDVISSQSQLWSTSFLIAEDSELGYFLTILLGYEATPSVMHLILYFSAIIVPITFVKLIEYKQSNRASLTKGTY